MGLSAKLTTNAVAGALGGLFGWFIGEAVMYAAPEFYAGPEHGVVTTFAVLVMWMAFWGAAISLFIGAGLGMVDGVLSGSAKLAAIGAALGAAVGLAGGAIGAAFGQTAFSVMLGAAGGEVNPDRVTVPNMLLRGIGFGVAGAVLGTAQGWVFRSPLRAQWGAKGGAIGGLIAGLLFLPVSWATTQFFGMFFNIDLASGTTREFLRMIQTGGFGRGVAVILMGLCIGASISIVEDVSKKAWLTVVTGRMEGREFILSKRVNTVGRSEFADVGLFGDPRIAPEHATIVAANGSWVLRDSGTLIGTFVNKQRVTSQTLSEGDVLQFGSVRLVFHCKERAERQKQAPPKPGPLQDLSPDMCPYCGQRKDPATGKCACTVEPTAPRAALEAAPVATQAPQLLARSGPLVGRTLDLGQGETKIGRDPSCDISLAGDDTVSRLHASIMVGPSGVTLTDRGSTNGTFVNGAKVTTAPLKRGDSVKIGESVFEVI
jgi:pSer/pThr/pTyr-binding forkhead associated (FHA) protein